MQREIVSLNRMAASINRGRRTRPTPSQGNNPLQSSSAKCTKERIRVKAVPSSVGRVTHEQKRRLSELARVREAELPQVAIESVMFSIYSTEEIKQMARIDVNNTKLFGSGSVNDPRMGPTDSTTLCASCSKDNVECPGHFGSIKLAKPIVHPLFQKITIDILGIVCNDCGGLLLTKDEMKDKGILRLSGVNRINALKKATEGLSCRRETEEEGVRPCNKNPTYMPTKSKNTNQVYYFHTIDGAPKENIRSSEEILEIFKNISAEDAALLGFQNKSHPSRFILEYLLVIPPNVRPPTIEDGRYMPDGLTKMYQDIIGHNNSLAEALKVTPSDQPIVKKKGERRSKKNVTIQDLENNLYNRLIHFIDNGDGWYASGGQPHVAIKQLIQTKEGLIRNNIMAKRVNYSARTVLSPDPTLAFGQISVPRAMVSVLTPKVRVNQYNRSVLQNLLEKGRITYITFNDKPSGEKGEIRMAGTRQMVTEKLRLSYTLQDGDVVERWLQDGDIVIFNRQPTLHLYSFMGYRAVIRDQKTFGLNLAYTSPLNADFDGDEGNLHIIQVEDSRAEVEELMSVRNCLINAQNNAPTMGAVFDAIVGTYLLTQPEATVDKEDFYDIVSFLVEKEQIASLYDRLAVNNVDIYTKDGEDVAFTGRALFSSLFPEDFYYNGPKGVVIKDGVLVKGIVTKSHIGPERNSIVHAMTSLYSPARVANFLTDVTNLTNRWIQGYGFSIGLSSCLVSDEKLEKLISDKIEEARVLVKAMGEAPTNPIELEKYENQILAYVGAPSDVIGKKLQETVSKENGLNIAVLSGAKGKMTNLLQIAAMLGQQHIGSKRIEKEMTYGTRCLPYFYPGEDSLESRGFCTGSFMSGLSPAEMYFHQMASRVGLMGTAVSTAETGYMHRKAVKALQDIKASYDGSVRNIDNTIFEYVYGDDGMSPNKLREVTTRRGKILSFFDGKDLALHINGRYGFRG